MISEFLRRRLFTDVVKPILIEFDPSELERIGGEISRQGLPIRAIVPRFRMMGVAGVPTKLIPVIADLPGVDIVHEDIVSRAFQLPGTGDQDMWWPTAESRRLLEAQIAFADGVTGESVKGAVVDTGIDAAHPQLRGSDFSSTIRFPVPEILDENGHGSHVSSTAMGKLWRSAVDVTVQGVSQGQLLSVKALGRGIGTGFTSEIVGALAEAEEKGAQVVNLSLGSEECQGGCEVCPECRAVKSLTDAGALVFVAAGNSGPGANTINCPGCSPAAITVAAIDRQGKVAEFSSRGGNKFPNKPDIAAPGVDIYSGTSTGSIIDVGDRDAGPSAAAISGTSMATPHASGLGYLLKQLDPSINRARFMAVVMAKGGSFNTITGYGVPKYTWFADTGPAGPGGLLTAAGRTPPMSSGLGALLEPGVRARR